MITQAYIQEYGRGVTEFEFAEVKSVLESRDIPCTFFTQKRVSRNQLDLNTNTLIVADNPTTETIFKRLKYQSVNESYPASLRPYLKRDVWGSSIKKMLLESNQQDFTGIFIKPSSKAKLFTGYVIHSNKDLYKLTQLSGSTQVYCSHVVEWISEYRIYVNKGQIVGIKNYDGDEEVKLDLKVVENAIRDFEQSDERTDGYGIDFGVLKNGDTAMVEWNDGYALGSYNLDKELYTDLILSRWNEILTNVFPT